MHTAVPLPGTLVWIRQRRWRVEHARLDRHVLRLDVANRDGTLTFLAPFDRPSIEASSERGRRVRRQRGLAGLAGAIARLTTTRGLDATLDAAIEVLPHQLEPALAIASGTRRVLIADTVGAGKTIQAGLVVAELRRRLRSARVLIAVPPALRDQWQDELRTRFAIEAAVADRSGLERAAGAVAFGDSPWQRAPLWIASLDFLKQPHVLHTLPVVPWDLVIVDEAHDACGNSDRHEVCDEIARRAHRLLLLTATPHCGDPARFARLLALGRLAGSDDAIAIFRRGRAETGCRATRRVRWRTLPIGPRVHPVFTVLRAFEAAVLNHAGPHRDTALLFLAVLRKRATSTLAALDRTLERRLRFLDDPTTAYDDTWSQARLDFGEPDDDLDAASRVALFGCSGLEAGHERAWLRRLRGLAAAALAEDPKPAALARLLGRTREPVVVFTEFRDSLGALKSCLDRKRVTAVLHGQQTTAERRAELGRFLDGSASVLLATDVASQGLNLQMRARWVISVELPWNPLRLEQRIGRVDRLGQNRGVHATFMLLADDCEAGLLARLARRAVDAEHAFDGEAAMPDETSLAAALMTQTPLPERAPAPPMSLCRRWQRPARRLARTLLRRRALIARWRQPRGDISGRVLQSRALRSTGPLLVFVVPLTDQHGVLVEQRVVPVRLARMDGALDGTRIVEAARDVAAARVLARAKRLRRVLAQVAAKENGHADAVATYLHGLLFPESIQLGIFDNRATRAAAVAHEHAVAIGQSATAQHASTLVDVRAGRPRLVFDGRGSR